MLPRASRRAVRDAPAHTVAPRGLREGVRRALGGALFHTGLLRVAERLACTHALDKSPALRFPRLRRVPEPKFGILCYHRVGAEGVPLFSQLHPAVFEAQIRFLKRHYRIVSLGQLCDELQKAREVPPTVAITFDDGYRDLYNYAFPVLRECQIPATIYLIGRSMETGEVPWYDRIFVAFSAASSTVLDLELDTPRRFELLSPAARQSAAWEVVYFLRTLPERNRREWCASFERRMTIPQTELKGRMLDWEQVRTMRRSGIDFGAHTMTHPVVSRLDASALEEELSHSRRILKDGLAGPVVDFSYPFGKPADCSFAAEALLARCGYRSAVLTTEGVNLPGANLLRLRRMQVGDDASLAMFSLRLCRMFLEAATDEPLISSDGGPGGTPVVAERKVP